MKVRPYLVLGALGAILLVIGNPGAGFTQTEPGAQPPATATPAMGPGHHGTMMQGGRHAGHMMKPVRKLDAAKAMASVREKIDALAAKIETAKPDLSQSSVEEAFEETGLPLNKHQEELSEAHRKFLEMSGAMHQMMWGPRRAGLKPEDQQQFQNCDQFRGHVLRLFNELELNTSELMHATDADAVGKLFGEHQEKMKELKKVVDEGPGTIAATVACCQGMAGPKA